MKTLLSFILVFSELISSGQGVGRSYSNLKTIAVGYSSISLRPTELNVALRDAGYPGLPEHLGIANVVISSSFGPRWGGFYGVDFVTPQSAAGAQKNYKFRFNRFYGGVEIPVVRRPGFALLGRAGISSSNMDLRLYDTVADTSTLTNYLTGNADAKLISVSFFSFDLGFLTELNVHPNIFLAVRGGYIVNPGTSDYRHDVGRFNDGPAVGLGSWYFGVQAGLHFFRHITRVDTKAWEFERRRKSEKTQAPATIM